MKFLDIPFVAMDYLTKGDTSNLNEEQIKEADKWAEMFEIDEVCSFMEDDKISTHITKSIIDSMDIG